MNTKPAPISEVATLRHYINQALHARAITKTQYGTNVAEQVMNTIPEADRRTSKKSGRGKTAYDFYVCLPSDDVDTLQAKQHHNMKKVFEAVDGDVQMVLHLRRALIDCLPEPYRSDCRAELYRHEGYLLTPIPGMVAQDAGELHSEYADVARSGGVLRMGDGQITENDSLADLQRHEKELMDLMSSTAGELALVKQAIEKKLEAKVTPITKVKP